MTPSLSVSVTTRRWSSIESAERIELFFGIGASFDLSYTAYGNLGNFKNQGTSLWNVFPYPGLKSLTTVCRSPLRFIELFPQRRTLSAINKRLATVGSWQYLRRSTFHRRACSVHSTGVLARTPLLRFAADLLYYNKLYNNWTPTTKSAICVESRWRKPVHNKSTTYRSNRVRTISLCTARFKWKSLSRGSICNRWYMQTVGLNPSLQLYLKTHTNYNIQR